MANKVIAVIAPDGTTDEQRRLANDMFLVMGKTNINLCANEGLETDLLQYTQHYFTCFIPWNTFNPEFQSKCDRTFSYQTAVAEKRYAAVDTCGKLYPKYNELPQGSRKLRARIYLAIEDAEEVIVFKNYNTGGNAEMAIAIAKHLNKKLTIINREGN